MPPKRLTIQLPLEQYELLERQARDLRTSLSAVLTQIIAEWQSQVAGQPHSALESDSFYHRRGSFDGPCDLAENYHQYLYGPTSP